MKDIANYIKHNQKIYTTKEREHILCLLELYYIEEMTINEIVEAYDIKKSTLYRYKKRFEYCFEHNIDFYIKKQGSILSDIDEKMFYQIIETNPWTDGYANAEWSTFNVMKMLESKFNVILSKRTTERLLQDYKAKLFYDPNRFEKVKSNLIRDKYNVCYLKVLELVKKERVIHKDKINLTTKKPEVSRMIILFLESDEHFITEIVNDYRYENTISFFKDTIDKYGNLAVIVEQSINEKRLMRHIDELTQNKLINNLVYLMKPKGEKLPMKMVDIIEILKDYLKNQPLTMNTLINVTVKKRILEYIKKYT